MRYMLYKRNWISHSQTSSPIHAPWLTADHITASISFLQYALAKGDVWIVTNRQLIEWMKVGTAAWE